MKKLSRFFRNLGAIISFSFMIISCSVSLIIDNVKINHPLIYWALVSLGLISTGLLAFLVFGLFLSLGVPNPNSDVWSVWRWIFHHLWVSVPILLGMGLLAKLGLTSLENEAARAS